VAEYFVFNSETLALFVDLIDDPDWKFLVFSSGIGRMHDITNFDFIKHRIKHPSTIRDVYSSFGILNLFCPFRPNGSYLLKMNLFEERLVCKMLCELAKSEGWANFTLVKIDGKPKEGINAEYLSNLPVTGTFEATYICPLEKEKDDLRMKIGIKYLEWP